MNDWILVFSGLVLLVVGGEILVRGAVGIAVRMNIPLLVIGTTIVSFGTSAPELLVSMKAALLGYEDITIGNVIGSNTANLGLVLGITAIIFNIPVHRNSLRFDWPMMMLSSALFLLFAQNGVIEFWEGCIFTAALIGFGWFLFWHGKQSGEGAEGINPVVGKRIVLNISFFIGGCAALFWGAELMIDGSVSIAESYGISERIIGLTIIAVGTSLPELITSVLAAYKKQTDLAVGNLIGSCIFNTLGILGITSLVKPVSIAPEILQSDIWWMLGLMVLLFPMMWLMKRFNRGTGIVLFAIWAIYMITLLMETKAV